MSMRSWAGPSALAVALASVAGGAVYLSRGSGPGVHPRGDAKPPLLRLASTSGERAALGAPSSGESGYQLDGTLSADRPADGRVRHPRHGSADAAAELAAALGLAGTPTAISGGWALRGPATTVLILRESGNWTWQLDCTPDAPITSEAADTGCAVASTSGSTGPPPGPSDADAISSARPVLDALGFGGVPISAGPGGDSQTAATVTPASGWSTSVLVSAAKQVVGGNGWLSGSTEGDAYPLISAADAFEALKAQPRMVMDLCMQRKDGQPGCEQPPPTVITGASLGLMLDYVQPVGGAAGPLLVPAWLFAVKGSTETIPVVAIDPAYLEQPSPEPVPTGKPEPGASSDPGTGTEPGQAPPPQPDPSSQTTEALPIDAYSLEGDRVIHVRVEYGGCDKDPQLHAKQGPDAVYLVATIVREQPQGDNAGCSTNLLLADLTVTLDAALGDRKVYDAHDMRELARRK